MIDLHPELKTHQQIWGRPYPEGLEWDAGYTGPFDQVHGRWTVILDPEDGFLVFFANYVTEEKTYFTAPGRFPASDPESETKAKALALNAASQNRYRPDQFIDYPVHKR